MKKRNKLMMVLIAGVLMLSGCQLASGERISGGNLIGVLITTQDMPYHDEMSAPQAIYDQKKGTYIFEDMEGYYFYSPLVHGEGGVEYYDQVSSGHLSEVKNNVHLTDNVSTAFEVEASLYFTKKDMAFYVHNVRQNPSGEVYVERTSGGLMPSTHVEGEAGEVKVEDTSNMNVKGKMRKHEMTFTIRYIYQNPYAGTTVIEFDEAHQILKETRYTADEVPESFSPTDACAYLIIEREKIVDGESKVERDMVEKGTETFPMFEEQEGILIKHAVLLEWKK